MGVNHANFVVPVFREGDLCAIDGKKTHFMFAFMVPSEIYNFRGFIPRFSQKNRGNHASFVVPVFQVGDLCAIDGKTDSFQVYITGSKRNFGFLWF